MEDYTHIYDQSNAYREHDYKLCFRAVMNELTKKLNKHNLLAAIENTAEQIEMEDISLIENPICNNNNNPNVVKTIDETTNTLNNMDSTADVEINKTYNIQMQDTKKVNIVDIKDNLVNIKFNKKTAVKYTHIHTNIEECMEEDDMVEINNINKLEAAETIHDIDELEELDDELDNINNIEKEKENNITCDGNATDTDDVDNDNDNNLSQNENNENQQGNNNNNGNNQDGDENGNKNEQQHKNIDESETDSETDSESETDNEGESENETENRNENEDEDEDEDEYNDENMDIRDINIYVYIRRLYNYISRWIGYLFN